MNPDDATKERREQLIEEIRVAFDEVRGGAMQFRQALERDSGCPEIVFLDEDGNPDGEERWQNLPEEVIARESSVFCFIEAVGFQFCIPAYMIWMLRNYWSAESDTPESIIWSFRHKEPLHELLDPDQCKAVAGFLEFCAEYDDEEDAIPIQKSLKGYWKKYRDDYEW